MYACLLLLWQLIISLQLFQHHTQNDIKENIWIKLKKTEKSNNIVINL